MMATPGLKALGSSHPRARQNAHGAKPHHCKAGRRQHHHPHNHTCLNNPINRRIIMVEECRLSKDQGIRVQVIYRMVPIWGHTHTRGMVEAIQVITRAAICGPGR